MEDRIGIQNDLDKLERWSESNKMKFNKGKCKTLHLRRRNQMHKDTHNNWVGKRRAENESEVIVDHKLNESTRCRCKAGKMSFGEVLLAVFAVRQGKSLFNSALMRPLLES